MIIRQTAIISSIFFILTSSLAFSAEPSSYNYKKLQQLADKFVQQQVTQPDNGRVEVVVNSLDPRMAPKVCSSEPSVSFARNSGLESYTTVEIQCSNGHQPWRTYVPVRIYQYQEVWSAAVPMSPGHLISEADLRIAEVDINQVRANVFTDKTLLVGARVKRRVSAGDAIEARDTCLVCEGESVTIVAQDKSLRITASGKALGDGLQGESVAVRNVRSNKSLEAVVTGLNEVTVNL